MTTKPETIDAYIASFPPKVQKILKQIRMTIIRAVPGAEESISYRIPTFKLNGPLIYFAAFKAHIGFYPMNSAIKQKFKKELSGYKQSKGTVRLPLDRPIPYALIGKIVQFRAMENRTRTKQKK